MDCSTLSCFSTKKSSTLGGFFCVEMETFYEKQQNVEWFLVVIVFRSEVSVEEDRRTNERFCGESQTQTKGGSRHVP